MIRMKKNGGFILPHVSWLSISNKNCIKTALLNSVPSYWKTNLDFRGW